MSVKVLVEKPKKTLIRRNMAGKIAKNAKKNRFSGQPGKATSYQDYQSN